MPVLHVMRYLEQGDERGVSRWETLPAQSLHGVSAEDAAGIDALDPVGVHNQTDGGAYRIGTMVPVDEGVRNHLPHGNLRVLRDVVALDALHDGRDTDVASNECPRVLQHLWDGALDSPVVQEALALLTGAHMLPRHSDRGDAAVPVEPLGVIAKRHHSGKRRGIIAQNSREAEHVIVSATLEARAIPSGVENVSGRGVRVEHAARGVRVHRDIVGDTLLESVDLVQLGVGHALVSITNAHVGPLEHTRRAPVCRALPHHEAADVGNDDRLAVQLPSLNEGIDLRLHLAALLDDALLQRLGVVDAAQLKAIRLVDAKDDGAAFLLVRERGERVIYTRSTLSGRLHLNGLRLATHREDFLNQLIKELRHGDHRLYWFSRYRKYTVKPYIYTVLLFSIP